MILLGGGFAIAVASESSGLSFFLGDHLKTFGSVHTRYLMPILCIMAACVSNVVSNAATASIILPVIKDLSLGEITQYKFLINKEIAWKILPIGDPNFIFCERALGVFKSIIRGGLYEQKFLNQVNTS